jgi:hypothetical protein
MVRYTRIDLEEVRIDGDTVQYYTSDGPSSKELRRQDLKCKSPDQMAKVLNDVADQFVPIYDGAGNQINPYYGDKSIGMGIPGKAFHVEKKKRATPNPQRRKKWKLAAAVSASILGVILGVFALSRILTPAEPPVLGHLSSTQRHSSGTIFSVSGAAEASQSGGGVRTGIRVKTGQRFIIHATGLSGYGAERGSGRCDEGPTQTDPNGKRKVAGISCAKRSDPATSLGDAPLGSLIARIGSGDWFLVGRGVEVTARNSGELAFAVNDSYYGDNPTSSFKVTVASE